VGDKVWKKGEGEGGMIMGVRKELTEEGEGFDIGTEGIIVGDIILEKTRWRILGVYVDRGIKEMKRKVEGWLDKSKEGRRLLVGGDFNARIEREGGGYEGENGEKRERRAKDDEWGRQEATGVDRGEWVGSLQWRDERGHRRGYTFTGGRGNSTIDFVMGEEETREEI